MAFDHERNFSGMAQAADYRQEVSSKKSSAIMGNGENTCTASCMNSTKEAGGNMIRHLGETQIGEIHDAFVDAFSEYEVRMEMPIEKLQEMMTTRSYDGACSVGSFEGDHLTGFILVGSRETDTGRFFYDVATGVRKAWQGKRIGDTLLAALLATLPGHGVRGFVLEVLENNKPAQALYARHGFRVTRKLLCYECSLSPRPPHPALEEGEDAGGMPDSIPVETFCSFRPTWQNAEASYRNMPGAYHVVTEREDGRLIGYGIVHRKNGSILQIGIDPAARSPDLLRKLVAKMSARTDGPKLRYLNVEAGSAMEPLLREVGFTGSVNQFEMVYTTPRE